MKMYKLFMFCLVAITVTSLLFIGCKKVSKQEELAVSNKNTTGDPSLMGTKAYCNPDLSASRVSNESNKSVSLSTTVFNTDFVTAGVGGMRNVGTGTITLAGLSGTVTKAYLYWHGLTNASTDLGNNILVNGTPVNGTNIGVSSSNCWDYTNSQAYRADVTSLVQGTGNGNYALTGFGDMNPNGASLVVYFNDGNATNNRDVVVFEGNDSNIEFAGIVGNPNAPADPNGWNVLLNGINYTAGSANIQLHVADGQSAGDGALLVNAVQLVAAGSIFQGLSVPGPVVGTTGGNLWDIKSYDVTSFLSPGSNNLNLTTGIGSDCLGLVVALIDLPAGAAPPSECVVNPICKNATVTLVNGTVTVAASDVNNGSTASCGIASVTVSPNTFNCTNIGTNNVVLTVTDNNGNSATCNAVVTVTGELPTCSVTAVPSNNVYTGGVPTNIYIGYGPQSVTLDVDAPLSGAPYTYSWTPTAGLSSSTSGEPVFTPTTAGTYTFTVTVTNKYGCTSTCSITIHVMDVRCGKNMDKVTICHKFGTPAQKTLCIDVDGVADHLAHGDYLGECQ